ncbi:MerR family transcriptional regulator [Streptomyces sp. NPDC021224]|uniref:MerR family transcriptional regulator n=1 Tax=unclassified Streptomyces TaxID=2593676 RepID=UPI0037A45D9B
MEGETRYSIGELARRTGLTVKTVRFYSDRGIVTPAGRSPAGYRQYDTDAVTRLQLVGALRELGLDLPTVRQVVEREVPLVGAAAAHARALAVRIRVLHLQHAVLTVVAERGLTAEEADVMHQLARLSEQGRRQLVEDFLHAVFDGLDGDPALAGAMRSMTPRPADDLGAKQARAWVEWAELALDPDFRAGVRRMAQDFAADRARSGAAGPHRDFTATVRDLVTPAVLAGVEPAARDADPVVAALTVQYAHLCDRRDEAALRGRLLRRLEDAHEPRRDRHLQLLAVINGWPAPDDLAPVLAWAADAVRARIHAAAPHPLPPGASVSSADR